MGHRARETVAMTMAIAAAPRSNARWPLAAVASAATALEMARKLTLDTSGRATSWAAPHLTGIVARLLSRRPSLKPFEMKAILYWLFQARRRRTGGEVAS